jgi:multidrug efflux pump subunit AcrB
MSEPLLNEPESSVEPPETPSGQTSWISRMAANPVAANLIMLLLIVGGIIMAPDIKQEVFPEVQLDRVTIQVLYPGASPSEVEQGVILAVEEAVRGIDGVKEVSSSAAEGAATVSVELQLGADAETAQADIQSAVNRISSLPQDAERPVVSLATNRQQTLSVVVYGDVSESELRQVANQVRDDLLELPDITLVEVAGIRPLEVSIEVPQDTLRRLNLTLQRVAQVVGAASVELPAGGVKTESGEVLLRTTERRNVGAEFEEIVVLGERNGTTVTVGDIATVVDGFRDTDEAAFYEGQRAAEIKVFRVGAETPISVSDAVQRYVREHGDELPGSMRMAVLNDSSEIFRDRIQLLLENAVTGLILVMICLGLFLELRLAFWVTMGIPTSFLGVMLILPALGISINMISLFAFILVLGIVVDDAIVVGESIYYRRQQGARGIDAAISGAREVGMPVVFSVLTTVAAFAPLLFIPGTFGKFMYVIPSIVILILLMSLFESLFILPAHLGETGEPFRHGLLGVVARGQQRFSNGFVALVEKVYPMVAKPIFRARYLAVAIGLAILMFTVGVVGAGWVKFEFFPKIEGDIIRGTLTMAYGTSVEQTEAVVRRMETIAQQLMTEHQFEERTISEGIYARVGGATIGGGGPDAGAGAGGSHLGEVVAFLVPMDQRDIGAAEFSREWRERVGEIPGVESLTFNFNTGPASSSPIAVELTHPDLDVLERAASDLADRLAQFNGVFDIDDGFSDGKPQLDVQLRPEGRALGLTELDLASQLRASFYGAEAVRQQRGRDELRVFVRLPQAERRSEFNLESMMLRTPGGGEIPLAEAADVTRGRSYTTINRAEGRRVAVVSADVDTTQVTANEVMAALREGYLTELTARYPGLSWGVAGEQEEQAEVNAAIARGFMLALFAIYGLMAVAFRNYLQPVLIMFAIPFGIVGAVFGHLWMGYNLSLMSMFGLVALSGVVVNDSIVFVDAINEYRRASMSAFDAVVTAGVRRFRPILLTSLTTFLGLAPIMLEKSVQARFLIPMAISLAFGVLLTTAIALLYIPCLYLILEDVLRVFRRMGAALGMGGDSSSGSAPESDESGNAVADPG